jgi:ABC-type transporter Mla MlaB component
MATKDDRPTLLSKVAMFVRNPTKDWSELDQPEQAPDSGYDKQALKAMIERKRQNDFVRKREFDQLRKLRRRDPAAISAMARPSFFQTSLPTDPDGRAITLKKIDEIEAQMSKQWWKGKQEAAAQGEGFPVAKPEPPADDATLGPPVPEHHFEPTEASDLRPPQPATSTEFAATEMGTGMTPLAEHRPHVSVQSLGALAQGYDGTDVGFSTSKLFAIEVNDMATDPELEEAAIRFANGDDAGAEQGLLAALGGDALMPDVALSWAAALLDLYRATGNRSQFDRAVVEFGARFDKVTPQWLALASSRRPLQSMEHSSSQPSVGAGNGGAIWVCPSELTAQSMENLRDVMGNNPTPWHLNWGALTQISTDAMPLVAGLFSSLCDEPVALQFSDVEPLIRTLRSMTPSGDRNVDASWWSARLNALRTMQMQDEFELAALDYCVTFEVSPPAWLDARCQFENVSGVRRDGVQAATAPMGLNGSDATVLELSGEVMGDASSSLSTWNGSQHTAEGIVIDCQSLVRVDFSAAGSILNWVAQRQAEGNHVQFREVHRLVAAFFNVIGINEHARVVPRRL